MADDRDKLLNTPVENIGLSVRACNALRRAGCATLLDFCFKNTFSLYQIPGLWETLVKEIEDKIEELGISYDNLPADIDNDILLESLPFKELQRYNIHTFGDLCALTPKDLYRMVRLCYIVHDNRYLEAVYKYLVMKWSSICKTEPSYLSKIINELGLSPRLHTALSNNDIIMLGELSTFSEQSLRQLDRIGNTMAAEIKKKLEEYGLSLCTEDNSYHMGSFLKYQNISLWTCTCFYCEGIFSMDDLFAAPHEDIKYVKGLGDDGYREVMALMDIWRKGDEEELDKFIWDYHRYPRRSPIRRPYHID